MAHMLRVSDLNRILPSITAQPWFRQHRRLVWWCVQRIHAREMISYGPIKVRWECCDVDRKQAFSRECRIGAFA